MKGKRKLVILPLMATIALTGCDLFKKIIDLMYKDVNEFYQKEGYEATESLDEFNTFLQRKMYVWTRETVTYTNSGRTNTYYYSPHGDYISNDPDYSQFDLYSRYGERVTLSYGNSPWFSYSFEEQNKVYFDNSGLEYVDDSNYRQPMDEEHSHLLRMQEDDNGYLCVTATGFMFYVKKDLTEAYPYIQHNDRFEFDAATIVVPESDLLNEGKANFANEPKLSLPLPENYDKAIHHKDYYNSRTNEWYSYDVIIPTIKPLDYVPLLENNGFEVYRGEYHELFSLDGENGGEWIAYDSTHSFAIHVEYANPICVAKDNTDNFGVQLHVMPMGDKISRYGASVNAFSDWKDNEKTFMQETFGTVLPFINLGRSYKVIETKRDNGELPLESALEMDCQCYWIFDNFYKDVITNAYGELLQGVGFRKYVPPVDKNSDRSAYNEWFYSEDVKFAECYLNDELELAVKYGFDDIYGNYIKVFKYEDLIPWHRSLEEEDKTGLF